MQQAATARAMGPLVWLDMDQKTLDDAYDQFVYAPNRDQIHERNRFNSDRVRARIGQPRRLAYGPTEIEQLDWFSPLPNPPPHAGEGREGAPINVFIHGGAWRQRYVKDDAFRAEPVVRAGAHFVGLDFAGVENCNANLLVMADQVRRAVAWVWRNAKDFGGDPARITISAHSSGAHLGGNVVTTDWEKDYGVPNDVVKGALLCSGMYDLKPVRLSKRSQYVAFTDEVEEKLSSQRRLDRLNCPLVVAHGTYETPEFQRQARDFAAAVKAAGKPVTLLVADGYNHFEMAEMAGNPLSLLGTALLDLMKLPA